MIMVRRMMSRAPHKHWDIGGAEGIRTPDPLDANEVRYRTAPQPRITGNWPPDDQRTDDQGSSGSAGATLCGCLAGFGVVEPGEVDGVEVVQLDIVVVDAYAGVRQIVEAAGV